MAKRRLLLLAMSGVRVYNEELRTLGLTLPGFIERGRLIASLPSLGLLTLAAHTPPHWDIVYRECDDLAPNAIASQAAAIAEEGFDLIAVSVLTARVLEAYPLADALRVQGQTVVLGGLHVSMLPEEALSHADAVVRGEGEVAWPVLLHDFEHGTLQPLYDAFTAPPFRLNQSRVPRYDLLDVSRYNRLTLQTARGCPLDCAFCAASRLISTFKLKPQLALRRELDEIFRLWPKPFLELADDNTFANKRHARMVAELLGEYGAPWFTETDLSVVDDKELLRLLAQANCAQLLIGLESSQSAALHETDSRHWKQKQLAFYREKIARIQEHGIPVNGCFVLGFDNDDEGAFERTRDFIEACELCEAQITVLTLFPGTALYRRLNEENRLLRPVFWEQCTLFDVTFHPARMSVAQLENGFRQLVSEVYSDDAVARRRRNFRGCTRRRIEERVQEKTA